MRDPRQQLQLSHAALFCVSLGLIIGGALRGSIYEIAMGVVIIILLILDIL